MASASAPVEPASARPQGSPNFRKISNPAQADAAENRSFSEHDLEDEDEDEDVGDDDDDNSALLDAFMAAENLDEQEPPSAPSAPSVPSAPSAKVDEPEPAPVPAPAKPGMKMLLRKGNAAPPPPPPPAVVKTAEPAVASAPEKPAAKLALPNESMLAQLKARGLGTAVTPGAAACVGAGPDAEAIYSVEQFQEEWPEMPEEWEPGAEEETYGAMTHCITQACARINQLFEKHMIELTVVKAPDPVIREIGALVKLTFLRTAEAPRAYEMLDLQDRATIIKGLKVMAIKRHQTAISRAPRDAAAMSGALEGMIASQPELGAMLEGMDFDLDMGAM